MKKEGNLLKPAPTVKASSLGSKGILIFVANINLVGNIDISPGKIPGTEKSIPRYRFRPSGLLALTDNPTRRIFKIVKYNEEG